MRAGLARLEELSNRRWAARLAGLPQPQTARAMLRALFEEALPTDGPSRDFHLLWVSYAVLAISDRAFVEGPSRLERRMASILEQGKANAEFRDDVDAEMEASILLGLMHGLGTAVLIGQQSGEAAMACLTFQVDRLGHGPST